MDSDKEISAKILEYLKKNSRDPDAMDEIAIGDWWGGIQQLGPSLDDITIAIEELLVEGAIKKQDLENDVFYYDIS